VQEWIQGPLQSERIYLQGVDSTGRALAIIKVADHVADKKALKNMKLFVCYVMNAMVSSNSSGKVQETRNTWWGGCVVLCRAVHLTAPASQLHDVRVIACCLSLPYRPLDVTYLFACLYVCVCVQVALCDPQLNPRGRLVSMFDMTDASYANMDVAAMRMILVGTEKGYVTAHAQSKGYKRCWHASQRMHGAWVYAIERGGNRQSTEAPWHYSCAEQCHDRRQHTGSC
jgi:hypothetical protein